jgi:hypothetical protein
MKSGSFDIRHPRLLLRNIFSTAPPPSRLESAAHTISVLRSGIKQGGWNIDRHSSTDRAADLPNQTTVTLPNFHAVALGTGYFSLFSI